MNWDSFLLALPLLLGMGAVTWLISLIKHNVAIVDSLWSLMFFAASMVYLLSADDIRDSQYLLLTMIALWSLRLFGHLTVRNWGQEEDRRYAQIRANNQPGFAYKSLYLIFGLQALLSWIIGITLLSGLNYSSNIGWWQLIGLAIWLIGFIFEALGDYQLLRFKRNPDNTGKVLNTGLWRYTRHPNYFGEFLIWWGFYAFAIPSHPFIGLIGPLMMSFLLMKFSGVPMLEKDISKRRGEYGEYIRHTNAFFPGMPKEKPNEK